MVCRGIPASPLSPPALSTSLLRIPLPPSPPLFFPLALCVLRVPRYALRAAQCVPPIHFSSHLRRQMMCAHYRATPPWSVAAFLPLLFLPLHSPPPFFVSPSHLLLLSFSLLRYACCELRVACSAFCDARLVFPNACCAWCVLRVARLRVAQCVLRDACCVMRNVQSTTRVS